MTSSLSGRDLGKFIANEVWPLIQRMSRLCPVSRCLKAGGWGYMVSIGRKLRCNGIKHLQDRTEALGWGTWRGDTAACNVISAMLEDPQRPPTMFL